MYELVPAAEHAYYLNCPSKIGLVELGGGAVAAIDSGGDKDAGKKVLRVVFETYGLTMTFQQYGLMGSTLRSYLTWLQNRGRMTCEIENNRLLWRKA